MAALRERLKGPGEEPTGSFDSTLFLVPDGTDNGRVYKARIKESQEAHQQPVSCGPMNKSHFQAWIRNPQVCQPRLPFDRRLWSEFYRCFWEAAIE